MKILFLLDVPINSIGGAQKSTVTCFDIMKKNKHEVLLMCPQNANSLITNFDVIFFYKKKRRIISTILKIFRIFYTIRKFNFDIVTAQNPESAMIIGFLKKMKLIDKKTTTVFTDRGFLNAYTEEELQRIDWTLPGIDAIICTTYINQQNWIHKYPEVNTYCLNNIVENEWFDRESKDYSHSTINIGFCGRFDQYKRWDTVEEIIKKLSDDRKYMFFLTLTYDNLEQETKMNAFIKKFDSSSVKIYINLTMENMISFYDHLDIFILTSEGESFGRTLIEAMLRKTVVIGTNSGGVPEVIGKQDNLFQVNNVNNCIKIIKRYNIQNIVDEKNYFYSFARKKYSRENFEKKLLNIYDDILKGSRM